MAERQPAYPEKQAAYDLVAGLLEQRGIKHHELARRLYLSRGAMARKLGARYPDRFTPAEVQQLAGYLDLTPVQHAVVRQAHESPSQSRAKPLAMPGAPPGSPTSFVGRDWERGTVKRLLATARLLTLSGAGGCGKTRLAQEVVAELAPLYRDGIAWVDLAPLSDPVLVPQALALALGVRERPGLPLVQQIVEALRSRELLLVLDNCEHLTVACAGLAAALLRADPSVTLLVTSREPLAIDGETVWRVPSLAVPPDPSGADFVDAGSFAGAIAGYASVRLFCDRAAAVQPDFVLTDANAAPVARLCRRLDGIPLAIELAAARAALLSVAEIDARLAESIAVLAGARRDAPERHQTMRAALDWSHGLLTADEQRLFRGLAVFAGGFFLDAAVAVVQQPFAGQAIAPGNTAADEEAGFAEAESLELLDGLVRKSLVQADTRPERARYRLIEPVRQYARERLLRSGEADLLRDRHRDWYTGVAETIKPGLRGPAQQDCIGRLEREHDNFRVALAWSVEQQAAEHGTRLAMALWQFWEMRGYVAEGRAWFERLIAISDGASDRTRATLYNTAGLFARFQADHERALALFERSLAHARTGERPRAISNTLTNLGGVNWSLGRLDAARDHFEQSLALCRQLDLPVEAAGLLGNLGMLANRQSDFAAARPHLAESLALFRGLGDRWGEARVLLALGAAATGEGDLSTARAWTEASLDLYRKLGDERGEAWSLAGLAAIALHSGDATTATALYDESLSSSRRLGDLRNIALALLGLGHAALRAGDHARARARFVECLGIRTETGERWGIPECLEGLAGAWDADRPAEAARLLGMASVLRNESGVRRAPVDEPFYDATAGRVQGALGHEAYAAAFADGAAMPFEQALTLISALGPAAVTPGSLTDMHHRA